MSRSRIGKQEFSLEEEISETQPQNEVSPPEVAPTATTKSRIEEPLHIEAPSAGLEQTFTEQSIKEPKASPQAVNPAHFDGQATASVASIPPEKGGNQPVERTPTDSAPPKGGAGKAAASPGKQVSAPKAVTKRAKVLKPKKVKRPTPNVEVYSGRPVVLLLLLRSSVAELRSAAGFSAPRQSEALLRLSEKP